MGHAPRPLQDQPGEEVTERKRHGMPATDIYGGLLAFARERGAIKSHTKGSLSPLLWPLMEIKYLCRLRSVEVVALMEAHASPQGIYVARRKGSNDNIVKWSPRLRAAWNAAIALRDQILARVSNRGRPFPTRPDQRFIFSRKTCTPLTVEGLNSIWRYLKNAAVAAGVLERGQRVTVQGLKHRGVIDTKGSRRRRQRASGHKSEQMVVLYDHDVPVVQPAVPRAEANFREATISTTEENAKSQISKQKSGGPYKTRTYNQLIKSHTQRSGKSRG